MLPRSTLLNLRLTRFLGRLLLLSQLLLALMILYGLLLELIDILVNAHPGFPSIGLDLLALPLLKGLW